MLGRAQEILKVCAGKKIGVSVSGGSDSMCLLDFVLRGGLIDISDILVINFEHGIRGAESVRDSGFVADYCKRRGLKLYFKSADIAADAAASKRSIETEARLFRKSEYEKLISGGQVEHILLAHNLGDRTESVLMHIFRGCGIKGLIGPNETDGYIVRPLIETSKSEILEYVKKYSVPFVEDSTNADSEYDRNFLRNEVLPLIRQRWPSVDGAILGLSRIAEGCRKSMTESGGGYITDGGSVLIDIDGMNAASVMDGFAAIGIAADLTQKHIAAVLSLAEKQSSATIQVPHGGEAVREYNFVRLTAVKQPTVPALPFAFGGAVEASACAPVPEKGKLRFDADKLPDGCVIRTRESGDIFVPCGCPRKLLSDYLTDKKIPKYKRDGLLLVASGSEVYIIVGVEISDKIKLDADTKNAVEIKLKASGTEKI